MKIIASGATDKGMKRAINEDKYFLDTSIGLFIVADGMGGHLGGEKASSMAIEEIVKVFQDNLKEGKPLSPVELIKKSIYSANTKIFNMGTQNPSLKGMGTTVTLMFIKDKNLWLGHVGDSRAYLYREKEIKLLTSDHSWIEEQIKAGMLSDEHAKGHYMKNVITRSVGYKKEVEVDVYRYDAKVKDIFLLCSDGLSGVVSKEEICEVLEKHPVEDCPGILIHLANQKGGPDNITVITGRIEEV